MNRTDVLHVDPGQLPKGGVGGMSARSALEEMLQLIQRRALDIAALPVDRREGLYETIHEACRRASIQIGQSDGDAAETATKIVDFVRAIVSMIDARSRSEPVTLWYR